MDLGRASTDPKNPQPTASVPAVPQNNLPSSWTLGMGGLGLGRVPTSSGSCHCQTCPSLHTPITSTEGRCPRSPGTANAPAPPAADPPPPPPAAAAATAGMGAAGAAAGALPLEAGGSGSAGPSSKGFQPLEDSDCTGGGDGGSGCCGDCCGDCWDDGLLSAGGRHGDNHCQDGRSSACVQRASRNALACCW
jgi:hypothetical protein